MRKPLPKGHPLYHATRELIAAITAYEKMRALHLAEFTHFESSWRDFLNRIERVWTKSQAAAHTYPSWQKVQSEIVWLRKNDQLLRYLKHARDADEHSIQDMAKDWDAKIKVTNLTNTSYTLSWAAWSRSLLPVRNRGVTYEPPHEHLGNTIYDYRNKGVAEPVVVADLALIFYLTLINRILAEVISAPSDA